MDESPELGPSYDGSVMIDVGGDRGALIILAPPDLHLAEIELSAVGDAARRTHVAVRERRGPSGTRYAAIYPSLVAGEYTVWNLDGACARRTVLITGGEVTEVDWT